MRNKEKIEILNSIQIVVTYISEERIKWIKKQIDDLNILIDVHYFRGFTPSDSKEYILEKHRDFGYAEIDTQICCTRSFGAGVNWFVKNCPHKKYLITMEDDVCFIKEGFVNKIIDAVILYEKTKDEVDYIGIGYLPFDIETLSSSSKLESLYYNMYKEVLWTYDSGHKQDPCVWGNQMTLFTSQIANELSLVLHQENTDLVRLKVEERINKGFQYSNRANILITDHLTPLIFRQGIIYPPLAIEGDYVTLMGQDNNNLTLDSHKWSKHIDLNKYHINKN